MKGIDISHYQKGLTIRQLKEAGYDFAIIKLTEGVDIVDNSAFDFYREAYELGFPVGCYCYSHAVNAQQAAAEAGYLLDAIKGFPMPCGVFLDVEEPKQLGLSHDALLDVLDAWCNVIAQHGYVPGVYGSEGNLWAKVHPDELPDGALVWVAKWSRVPPNMPCDLWQSSDSGHVEGYSGSVDTDEVRSERFQGLVYAADTILRHHRDGGHGDPVGEPGPPGDPVELAADLLLAYLRTEEFAQNFKSYIERSKKI